MISRSPSHLPHLLRLAPLVAGCSFALAAMIVGTPPGVAAPQTGAAFAAQADRERVSLDAGWKFSLESPLANASGIEKWQWLAVAENPKRTDGTATLPSADAPWADAAPHQDTFQGRIGFSWYRATLPALTGHGRAVLFTAVDDNADVYLNGAHLIHHEGYNSPFTAALDAAWNDNGPNVLLVLVENTAGGGGITGNAAVGNEPNAQGIQPSAAEFDDSRWRTVDVPHDYMIEQPFTQGLDPQHASLPAPSAWYRKTIIIPRTDRDKDDWLDFDGIYRDAKIYVNGQIVGGRRSGYLPIHVDLSSQAQPGARLTIAVHVDPSRFEGWWYEGGGIYRHVWLTSVNRLRIEPDGVWVAPKAIGDEAHPDTATVDAIVTLKNTGSRSRAYTVVARVFSPSGGLAASLRTASAGTVAPGGTALSKSRLSLPHPLLWSLKSPNLYHLETSLEVDGRPVDRVVTTFGVRTVRFDPNKGFFLNGMPIKIKGVCNHQDFAGIGIAVPDNLQPWRVKKMQAMGANGWRMSHNPPDTELLDACDRLGMLVLDENRHLGDTYAPHTYDENTTANDLSDLAAMIVRDRNHPSVFAWSLCNEEPLQGTSAGSGLFAKMRARVRELDPTRLVTCAMNASWGKGISLVEDIQGCNYLNDSFEKFHQGFPNQPIIFTESSSAVSDRGIYENDAARSYVGNYTDFSLEWLNWARRTEDAWRPIAENDYLSGAFVWTGFDYKGEPSPYGWPNISSHFGILDTCGFPKDVYYYYKAYWGDRPAVHITPHWTWPGKEGKPVTVLVFSNAPTVDLILNGVSLGRKPCPRNGHAQWTVAYAPGTLAARGYDADGRLVATDQAATAGSPARIELRTDLPKLTANGEDVSVIEATIVDDHGNRVPTASDQVAFTAIGDAGRIAGTGNGDPNDHTPDASPVRSAFNGRLAAMIRSTGRRGVVTVTATGDGLQPARLTVQCK